MKLLDTILLSYTFLVVIVFNAGALLSNSHGASVIVLILFLPLSAAVVFDVIKQVYIWRYAPAKTPVAPPAPPARHHFSVIAIFLISLLLGAVAARAAIEKLPATNPIIQASGQ